MAGVTRGSADTVGGNSHLLKHACICGVRADDSPNVTEPVLRWRLWMGER